MDVEKVLLFGGYYLLFSFLTYSNRIKTTSAFFTSGSLVCTAYF